MKKYIVSIILALFVVVDMSAQNSAVLLSRKKGYKINKHEMTLGIKFGASLSRMAYSVAEFQNVKQEINMRPSFGFYFDYHFNKVISIAPEIVYSSKGVYHKDYNFIGNNFKASYKLMTKYIGFRLPLVFKINVSKTFQPYFFVAPAFSYCMGGKLDYVLKPMNANAQELYDFTNIHEDLTTADINKYDVSAIVGLGLRFRIKMNHTYLVAKFDVGYNYGITDNYGTAVKSVAKDMGKRYNRSLECMFTLGLPLDLFRDKSCVDFSSVYDIWY